MIKQENFAVFAHDRTQYVAIPGQNIDVEKLEIEEGKEYIIENVLLIKIGDHIEVGKPTVKSAKVVCKVVGTFKDQKVKIFKYHAKSRTRKTKGHRQQFTRLMVEEIIANEKLRVKSEEVKSEKVKNEQTKSEQTEKVKSKTTKVSKEVNSKVTKTPAKSTKKTTTPKVTKKVETKAKKVPTKVAKAKTPTKAPAKKK